MNENWIRKCSDKRLLELLSDANRLKAEGKPIPPLVEALKTEADTRNLGASFRPWYF